MKTVRRTTHRLGGSNTSQTCGVLPEQTDDLCFLDRPTFLSKIDFPVEVGIDTIRVRIPLDSKVSPWWHTQTKKRKAMTAYDKEPTSYGKNGLAYGKANYKSLTCLWIPRSGYTVECSVPKFLGLQSTSLATAEHLEIALDLIADYVAEAAEPCHLIPPKQAWTFPRTDIGVQFETSDSARLVLFWLAFAGSGTRQLIAAQHGSGKILRRTYKLRLYDKLAELGAATSCGRTLMRCEVEILGNGLRRNEFPYERNFRGIMDLLQNGIPKLLAPELKQLQIAARLQRADAFQHELLELCASPTERALVQDLLDTFPAFSIKERLKRFPPKALSPEVRRRLKLFARIETREFSALHPLPNRS